MKTESEKKKKTYNAHVSRDGKWWMISVPKIGLTQSRRLSDAALMASELIAVTLDMPIEDVAVDISIDGVGSVEGIAGVLASIRSERAMAIELEQKASREATQLAKRLAAENVPMRDVGTILGVSHQRAHQLVAS